MADEFISPSPLTPRSSSQQKSSSSSKQQDLSSSQQNSSSSLSSSQQNSSSSQHNSSSSSSTSSSQQNSSYTSSCQQNSSSSTSQSTAPSSNSVSEPQANSSSSGSGSLASTQPIEADEYQQRIEESLVDGWGQVVPVNPDRGYHSFILRGDEPITFGRHPDHDYVFRKDLVPHDYDNISKTHFHIQKQENGDVKIFDLSSNGTYVNETMVGKNREYPLTHLSTISLGLPNLGVFIFINHEDKRREDAKIPTAFKAKYCLENVLLGEGGCGTVKKCFLRQDPGRKFAVKIINKGSNTNRDLAYEASILGKVNHKNIVCVKDCFENDDCLYIVMELVCGGELLHYIKKKGPMAEEQACKFFLQLLHGVSYLHKNGITHRDLKPDNILLDDKDYPEILKITDFGLSRFVSENSLMETNVGTRQYLAPEVIDPYVKGYTKKVDSWALGCILFTILGGYTPFSQEEGDEGNMEYDILHGSFTFHPERWDKISEKAKDLVRGLLTINPNDRLSVDQALQHCFMRKVADDEIVPPSAKRVRHR